jgi:hypothetical protein
MEATAPSNPSRKSSGVDLQEVVYRLQEVVKEIPRAPRVNLLCDFVMQRAKMGRKRVRKEFRSWAKILEKL